MTAGVGLAIGFSLSALNMFAEFVFLNFTLLERHRSKSGTQLSMILKKLVLELINNLGNRTITWLITQ